MTLVSDLKTICKDIEGTFISIGLSYPNVESVLDNNRNITEGYILEFNKKKKGKVNSKEKQKIKKISIKKLRKTFKKKSVNTVLCNYNDIENYLRFFISDSVYINNGKLYIYGKKEEFVVEDLENYYNRYNVKINITEYEDSFLLEIDNSVSKNIWFKDKLYKFKDTINYYINCIGDILIG